mmetsp:Transcript_8821/g.14680  ORF Transcript_8821/g.14680 Transcript_8821/m.14680 type:complete len:288 (-) Transcript_8821:153-1016(-)
MRDSTYYDTRSTTVGILLPPARNLFPFLLASFLFLGLSSSHFQQKPLRKMFGSKSSSTGSTSFLGGGDKSSTGTLSGKVPGFEEDPACAQCCPKLTYKQRIYGYATTCAIGWVLSLIGTLVLFGGTSAANIRLFIILYVLGNIIALCASGFLSGPAAQCRKMWLKTRRFTTAFYLFMIVVVFVVAVLKQNVFLVLFLLVIEILAGSWYSLSFIPFGRKVVLAFIRRTGICMPCFFCYDSAKETYEQTFPPPTTTERVSAAAANVTGGKKKSKFSNIFGGGSKSGENV